MNKPKRKRYYLILLFLLILKQSGAAFRINVEGVGKNDRLIFKSWSIGDNLDRIKEDEMIKNEHFFSCLNDKCTALFEISEPVFMADLILEKESGTSYLFKDWYIQSDDAINIHISYMDTLLEERLMFKGKGSEKYQLQYDIDRIFHGKLQYPRYAADLRYFDNDFAQMFDYERAVDMNIYLGQLLDSLGKNVDPFIRERIADKYFYKIFDSYFINPFNIVIALSNAVSPQQKEVFDKFQSLYEGSLRPNNTALSIEFIVFYLKYLDVQVKLLRQENFTFVFDKILNDFVGKNREIMYYLALSRFYRRMSPSEKVAFIKEGMAITTDIYRKSRFLQMSQLEKGRVFPEFDLIDVNGLHATKATLANKVIFFDFYYTGCGNCAAYFKNKIIKAEEYFRGHKDVLFVSVSIDRDKTVWKRSIDLGLYNSDYSLKLYTGGVGSKHPLIDELMIKGYPYSILVDKDGYIETTDRWELGVGRSSFENLIFTIERTLKK